MIGTVTATTLANIADINPPLPFSVSGTERVSFVPMSAASAETADVNEADERSYAEVSKGFTPFLSGDLLVAKITPCFENGKIIQATIKNRIGLGSTEFHVVRPHADSADARYLLHFLRQDRIRRTGERRMTGSAGQRRVPEDFLVNLAIPLPPISEQRRIGSILDKADALRTKRRAALERLAALPRSTFLEMFGDPITDARGWRRKPLSEIGTVITGNTPSRSHPEYFGASIEWIKSDNINTPDDFLTPAIEGLSEAGKRIGRIAPKNSILVTCIAGTPSCIGNAALADREVAFNQQINAVVPNGVCNPFFLYCQFVLSKALVQRASTASMKGMVTKSRFEAIEFIVPPRDLQDAFAETLVRVFGLRRAQQRSMGLMDALFASLEYRAFTGGL